MVAISSLPKESFEMLIDLSKFGRRQQLEGKLEHGHS